MESCSVYRVSPRRRAALVGIWLLFALPLALGGLLREPSLLLVAAIVSAIFLPIIALTAWWYPRLVLTPDGLALIHLGWSLETPWANVASLRRERGGEGFVLREPLRSPGAARLVGGSAAARYYSPEQLALIAARRFVPIEAFAYWLHEGRLARDLERYAPRLLAGAEPER